MVNYSRPFAVPIFYPRKSAFIRGCFFVLLVPFCGYFVSLSYLCAFAALREIFLLCLTKRAGGVERW
jgi:hypothetical protein